MKIRSLCPAVCLLLLGCAGVAPQSTPTPPPTPITEQQIAQTFLNQAPEVPQAASQTAAQTNQGNEGQVKFTFTTGKEFNSCQGRQVKFAKFIFSNKATGKELVKLQISSGRNQNNTIILSWSNDNTCLSTEKGYKALQVPLENFFQNYLEITPESSRRLTNLVLGTVAFLFLLGLL